MGPDHLGYAVPSTNVNASLNATRPLPGHIALLCQSAAIMRSVIDWATGRNIGFSHVISVGMRWDVDLGDLIDYLLRDGNTRAILMYMENTRNRRKFVSAARAAARVKPVIVLKPRDFRTGPVEDAVYDAVFQRAGILRVNNIEQLFGAAETVATAQPVYSDRLTIISNSYSLALMTSDTLLRHGGRLAEISERHPRAVGAHLPTRLSDRESGGSGRHGQSRRLRQGAGSAVAGAGGRLRAGGPCAGLGQPVGGVRPGGGRAAPRAGG